MNADNRVGIKHIPRITGILLLPVFMNKEQIERSFKRDGYGESRAGG